MTANLTLALVAGLLVACGVYLLTERSLSRILMGVILMSNGVNVLFLVAAGRAGRPAILGQEDPSAMTDPLPQAFQLSGHDEVRDDVEDRRIRELAQRDETSTSFEEQTFSDTGEDVVSE